MYFCLAFHIDKHAISLPELPARSLCAPSHHLYIYTSIPKTAPRILGTSHRIAVVRDASTRFYLSAIDLAIIFAV